MTAKAEHVTPYALIFFPLFHQPVLHKFIRSFSFAGIRSIRRNYVCVWLNMNESLHEANLYYFSFVGNAHANTVEKARYNVREFYTVEWLCCLNSCSFFRTYVYERACGAVNISQIHSTIKWFWLVCRDYIKNLKRTLYAGGINKYCFINKMSSNGESWERTILECPHISGYFRRCTKPKYQKNATNVLSSLSNKWKLMKIVS